MTEFCYNHPKTHVKCDSCGKPLCPTCIVHVGRDFCPQCAEFFPAISHACTNHPENYAANQPEKFLK